MPMRYLKPVNPEHSRNLTRRFVLVRHEDKDKQRDARLPKKPRSLKSRLWRLAWRLALIFIIVFPLWVLFITRNLPNPNQLIDREIAQSTKIFDRSGENVLYEIHGDQKRTLVALGQIPDRVKQATISIEDKNFYKHGAISYWSIFRTLVTNVIYHRVAGGSTLTQQFVKNALLSDEKTITRKVKEVVMSVKLENKFNKDQILQMYLNEIPYGSNAYGVEAASQKYFGKNVKDINLAEAAILAALPQAPSRYSPYGQHKDLLISRQQYILDLMAEQGYINNQERDEAKKFDLKFAPPESAMVAPHFIMYVKQILEEKYGEKTVEQDGLKIYTTLDVNKQKIAEEVLKAKTEKYQEKYNASNAALLSLDPKTGQVLAMVGSRDYFNDDIDGQVNITTALRQPGSSIKPIVYATLFTRGYTPNTILYDVVTNFSAGGKAYEPHDYDNKERGPVTVRQALAGSLNIPAVKAIYLAGIDNVIKVAKDLGYTTLTDPERLGLSLVLGGGEVRMLEHVNAFSALAREGQIRPTAVILKVEDKNGKVLEEWQDKKRDVLPGKIAQEINSILTDNNARAYIFGIKNYLTLPDRPVAAKTGTTNDFKDAWTIGYTPSVVTGVWVGNNNGSEMKSGADGSVVAAPIWNEYMRRILSGTPVETFNEPGDLRTGKAVIDGETYLKKIIKINKSTGEFANDSTPIDQIQEIVYNNPHCLLYYVDKNDPLGPRPKNPASDPQFNLWESRVLEWAKKNGYYNSSSPELDIDKIPGLNQPPSFSILSPGLKEEITSVNLTASISIASIAGSARVEYFLNDNLAYKTQNAPYDFNSAVNFLNNGQHTLRVRVCDDFSNCSERSVVFNLQAPNNNKAPEINLTSPSSGASFGAKDFPVKVKMQLTEKQKISKIKVYYTDSQNNKNLMSEVNQISNDNIEIDWLSAPSSGVYKVYVEFYDWSNNLKKSNKNSITIN